MFKYLHTIHSKWSVKEQKCLLTATRSSHAGRNCLFWCVICLLISTLIWRTGTVNAWLPFKCRYKWPMETESPWNTGNKIDSHLGRTKRLNTMQTLIMLCFRCQRASWEVGVTEPKSLRAEPLAPPPPHFLYWKWSAPHSEKINKRCQKIPIFSLKQNSLLSIPTTFLAQPLLKSCKIWRSHTSSLLKLK